MILGRVRLYLLVIFGLAVSHLSGQTLGPIQTPKVNSTLYVGSATGNLPYYPSVQSAVTAACLVAPARIVIPASSTITDSIPAVTGGCATAPVVDERTFPSQCYSWTSGTYTSTSCVSSAFFGTVNSVSVTSANGVSAVITNPTTTPNLTFTLGAINPTSVGATTPGPGAFTTISSTLAATLGASSTVAGSPICTVAVPCSSGGSGVYLETNGGNNLSQNIFNLVNGGGVQFSNTSGGDVTTTLGAINPTSTGSTTPAPGAFTTLSTSGSATLGASSTVAGSPICTAAAPCSGVSIETNGAMNSSQTTLNFVNSGGVTFTNPATGELEVSLGAINPTSIGATTPAPATVTSLTDTGLTQTGSAVVIGTNGILQAAPANLYDAYGAAAAAQAASLQVANNLSDLSSVTTARTNLGLGTMATQMANAVAVTGGTLTGVTVNGVTLTNSSSSSAYLNGAGAYTTPPSTNFTLGNTAIAGGSTTTAVTGLTVNGVVLTNADASTTYLNGAGTYSTPAGSGSGVVNSGTAYSVAYFPATGTAVSGVTPFTGLGYFSTSAAPAAATSTQVQTAIGASVYDAYGAATTAQTTAITAAEAAFTGDVTKSAGSFATTVTAVNGGAVPASASVLASNSTHQLIAGTTVGTGSVVLANGTPAAGSYIDGAADTWTALPFKSLTTTGSSGAATLTNGVLNIPQYGGGTGSGTVNTGTIYGLAYYAATGTAVSGVTPFTGLGYFSTSAAPAAATTTEIQSAIGSGVYDASGAATTALTSAEAYSSNASNLTSGTVAAARLPSFTLGTTPIAPGSTTTSVTGLTVNGVALTTADAATTYLNGAGTYSTPAGSGSGVVNSGTAYSPAYYAATGTAVSGVTPFTGIGYWSAAAAPAAATSAEMQTAIGAGVYDASGAATTAQTNAEAAFTGDVTKTAGSFATTVTQIEGAAIPLSAKVLASNASHQLIAGTTVGTGSVVLANGTPAAGEYIDGASEAWTALPFKSLTTTGTGGAATLTGGVLNIPEYTGGSGGLGSVTLSGTPVTGAVPLGETSTTADWAVPPSVALYTANYHSAGTDICAWIAAAMAALPSTGGAVSTAGEANFASTNQCSAANTRAMFAGSYGGTDKFTHLYVGAQTIQIPVQLIIPYGSEISGINLGFPSDGGSVIQATSSYVASEPYTSVSCSGTTQLCTVTTSAATGVVVGSQILVVPNTASGVAPFAQMVTAVTSSTQFVFPEWINCNTTPNTVNCAGGTNYPATTYAALTTGTIIVPMVAIGDIQFSEMTRLDHITLDMGNVTAGDSIAYFSQTMNENSGSNTVLINNTTYAGFDIEAGGDSATLGSGNYDFNYISVGPTAGVCGRLVEAYGNEYRGIHEITCNAFTSGSPLAQGIIFDGPDGENGPFHFENFTDAVVLQGSFPQNTATSGEGLGSAFTIRDVTCFTNVTNCVHTLNSTNTPTNFTLRDIQANGATNVYMNAAGVVPIANNYLVDYVDGTVEPITTTSLTTATLTATNGVFTNPISAGGFGLCESNGTNCPASILSVGVANTGNGVTGTSSGGTNPVLTISLGNITPTGMDLESTDTILSDTIATFMEPDNPGNSTTPGYISFQVGHDQNTNLNSGIFTFNYFGSGSANNSFSFGVNGGTEVNLTATGLISAPGGFYTTGNLTANIGTFTGLSENGYLVCDSNGDNCPAFVTGVTAVGQDGVTVTSSGGTAPELSISLGAITPTSVTVIGNGVISAIGTGAEVEATRVNPQSPVYQSTNCSTSGSIEVTNPLNSGGGLGATEYLVFDNACSGTVTVAFSEGGFNFTPGYFAGTSGCTLSSISTAAAAMSCGGGSTFFKFEGF
jgi:hypothetical protein